MISCQSHPNAPATVRLAIRACPDCGSPSETHTVCDSCYAWMSSHPGYCDCGREGFSLKDELLEAIRL